MRKLEKKWLTLKDTATYLGMKPWGVRELVRLRRIKYHRRGEKGNLMFKTSDVDAWLERHSVEPLSE